MKPRIKGVYVGNDFIRECMWSCGDGIWWFSIDNAIESAIKAAKVNENRISTGLIEAITKNNESGMICGIAGLLCCAIYLSLSKNSGAN